MACYIDLALLNESRYDDLEQIPAPLFYRWLNRVAKDCGIYWQFLEISCFVSIQARYEAIRALHGIAERKGIPVEQIMKHFYTEAQIPAQLRVLSSLDEETEKRRSFVATS